MLHPTHQSLLGVLINISSGGTSVEFGFGTVCCSSIEGRLWLQFDGLLGCAQSSKLSQIACSQKGKKKRLSAALGDLSSLAGALQEAACSDGALAEKRANPKGLGVGGCRRRTRIWCHLYPYHPSVHIVVAYSLRAVTKAFCCAACSLHRLYDMRLQRQACTCGLVLANSSMLMTWLLVSALQRQGDRPIAASVCPPTL